MEWTRGPADTWHRLQAFLEQIAGGLPARPRAVLVVSGHWETPRVTVNTAAAPPLYFDYYGFPEHTYRLTYPAPGSPTLAAQVATLLGEAGFPCATDGERGLDHGVFIPFKLIFPDADVPVVQMSLREGLDPAEHLAIGAALAPLRDDNVLIVGSGMSYHNLRAFGEAGRDASKVFDDWLGETVGAPTAAQRNARLREWAAAPAARFAHPREEHLLPLMVAAGAAGDDAGRTLFSERVGALQLSAYSFG